MSTIDLSNRPYYDDYDENKKYHQILFRPTFAVQARELNQLQTILQNQISRFGSHIFKNGSVVLPGGFSCQNDLEYVTIQQDQNNPETLLSQDVINSFVGKELFTADISGPPEAYVVTKKVTARIVAGLAATASEPMVLYVKYDVAQLPVTEADTTLPVKKFVSNDILYIENIATSVRANNSTTALGKPITGFATAFKTFRGVYFVNGYFVISDDDIILIDKFFNNASAKVGYRFNYQFITPSDDSSLFDNAENSLNFTAPGAHRLKIDLPLVTKTLSDDTVDSEFIQLARIEKGSITEESRRPDYSVLSDELARRTYDESGNYIIDPFVLEVREHLNSGTNRGSYTAEEGGLATKYVADLDPGKAYVFGYEVETVGRKRIDGNKSRTTKQVNNGFVNAPIGYYLRVNPAAFTNKLPKCGAYDSIELFNASAVQIGTGRARGLYKVSSTEYYLYVFNIVLDTGYNFSQVSEVRQSLTSFRAALIKSTIYEAQENTLIYRMPYKLIASAKDANNLSDTTYSVVKEFTGTVNSDTAVITTTGQEEFATVNSSGFIAVDNNSTIIAATFANTDATTLTVTTTGVANGTSIRVQALVNVRIGIEKKKVLQTNGSKVVSSWNPQSSAALITLNKADVVSIRSITYVSGSVTLDLTSKFSFDSGQTDSFYNLGSVTLQDRNIYNGNTLVNTAGTLTITFNYYNHTGTGDYFSVDSYNGIDYAQIPTYASSSGDLYELRDCLDFRPRIDDVGSTFTGSGSSFARSLVPDSSVRVDFSYYLARIDKLVVTGKGEFRILEGIPSETPVAPKDLQGAMTLYIMYIPAYTFSAKDILVKTIDNRRYTMRDIGALENRIQNLEYYTSLSLLEKETKDLLITDSSGNDRFKNGFVVDNFTTQLVSDYNNIEYQIAVDQLNGIAGPIQSLKHLNLDVISFTGMKKIDDLLMLDYTEEAYIQQVQATRIERITPYDVFGWIGTMKLVPESDSWFSTAYAPDQVNEKVEYVNAPPAVLKPATQPTSSTAGAVVSSIRSNDNNIANNSGNMIYANCHWYGIPANKAPSSQTTIATGTTATKPVLNSGPISTSGNLSQAPLPTSTSQPAITTSKTTISSKITQAPVVRVVRQKPQWGFNRYRYLLD